jgi:hypothetical protein
LNEIETELLRYAKVFDEVIDLVLPTLIEKAEQRTSFRHKVAGKLQERLFDVALSIANLTKIAAKVELKAISENSQSILALSRVLIELCNKFNYLALSPRDASELKLRTLYFSLVGAVKYKKLLESIEDNSIHDPERDRQVAHVEKIIDQRKSDLTKAGFRQWKVFRGLKPEMQKEALQGKTQDDYLKKDFELVMNERLNPKEKKHYQDLGSVAIHSSAFVISFYDDPHENESFLAGVVCLALFNASRHLALCTLEATTQFSELKARLESSALIDLRQLAEGLKNKDYLKT